MSNIIVASFFAVLLSTISTSYGQSFGSRSSFEFKFLAGLKVSYGSTVSEDKTSIEDRKHAVYAIDSAIGIRWNLFIIGYGVDYSIWKQLKDPKDLSNSNTQGKMTNHSIVGGLSYGRLTLLGKYHINSSYKFDVKNSDGDSQKYFDPTGGLSVQLIWRKSKNTYVGVDYTTISLTKSEINGTKSLLSTSSQFNLSSLGLIYGYTF